MAPSSCFNPRAHAGRDSMSDMVEQGESVFQSTRPRGARLYIIDKYLHHEDVSIHAPTRGATREVAGQDTKILVSIHAPTRGATKTTGFYAVDRKKFQSTRPRGARHAHYSDNQQVVGFQSTRPRGAKLIYQLLLIKLDLLYKSNL